MTRRRIRTIVALAFVGTWLALAIDLARSEDDAFIGLALIALTPMIVVALFALPEAFRARSPNDTLRAIAHPFIAVCMATSFLLLATVVGGTLWGWVGGLAGVMLGALLATQIILAMSQILRATSGAPRPEASLPNRAERRKVFATAVLSGGCRARVFRHPRSGGKHGGWSSTKAAVTTSPKLVGCRNSPVPIVIVMRSRPHLEERRPDAVHGVDLLGSGSVGCALGR